VDYKEVMLSVSSLRIDGVVAKLYQLSRSQSLELFVQQKIFLNGRVMEHNSAIMKQGDVLSVRGFGKSKLGMTQGTSKKGKLMVQVLVYQ
jgi:RNA-binding protein YlmH